ncbi:unnamed protein product [Ceutorhynchus assimilis]|uniref:Chitin-binding type-2 domain-containing protein n=1 Tax=Ceutorhynchus assimilis TaxID=467358 RepID=A0A9N9N0B9_9CUCU|nr:unnamed protein product [Ceutorhynchus assimilis]
MKFLRFFLVLGANLLVPSLAIGLRNDPTPSTSTAVPPPERRLRNDPTPSTSTTVPPPERRLRNDPTPSTSTSAPPPERPPCPADCPHPLFVPDRDCCKYWQCNCGTGTLLSCPSGLNWNPVLDTCDWPGSARCTGQGWRKADLKCPKNSSSDEDDSSNNSSQEENSSNNSSQEKNSSNNSSQEKNSSNNSSQENSSNNSSQENDSSNEDKSSNENN